MARSARWYQHLVGRLRDRNTSQFAPCGRTKRILSNPVENTRSRLRQPFKKVNARFKGVGFHQCSSGTAIARPINTAFFRLAVQGLKPDRPVPAFHFILCWSVHIVTRSRSSCWSAHVTPSGCCHAAWKQKLDRTGTSKGISVRILHGQLKTNGDEPVASDDSAAIAKQIIAIIKSHLIVDIWSNEVPRTICATPLMTTSRRSSRRAGHRPTVRKPTARS